ncbi:MAG TPA: hypothetical protein DF296_01825 [Candidatus Margulisbacteria bacterium]|nr:hypothetical protein [Candidatus Margulisiibacteriota bacterium]HCT83916.1 hypothetical protein [Candidatus Margulisiibacteriota bacterium]
MRKCLAGAVLLLLLGTHAGFAESYEPIWRVNTTNLVIALTFDDGPKPEYSIPVLDILDKYCIKATFFIVGKMAKIYPDTVYRMAISGHEVGNHTFSHVRLDTVFSPQEIEDELKLTNQIIEKITGSKPKYFRPPGGRFNQFVIQTAFETGLKQINWSLTAADYIPFSTIPVANQDNSEKIVERVISQTRPGSIILLHNGGNDVEKALPKIIEQLRQKGFKFVTISELLGNNS